MILWVIHDESGNIRTASAHPADGITGPPVGSTERIVEVDAPELADDADHDVVFAYLARVVEHDRVELTSQGAKLVSRTD